MAGDSRRLWGIAMLRMIGGLGLGLLLMQSIGWPESAGAKDKTRAAQHVASFACARGVVPAPAAGLSGAGQNPSRPSVTAGQPHPSSCLANVHAKTALSRTCPDQEMAAIGSRDTSGQGLGT